MSYLFCQCYNLASLAVGIGCFGSVNWCAVLYRCPWAELFDEAYTAAHA